MSQTLGRIRPTLNYGDFGTVDIIIEAVVENPKVKKAVFAEVEPLVRDDTIIASNTSTISICIPGGRPAAAAELRRHALLQPGAHDAAGRSHPRQAVVGRGRRRHGEAREQDGQDTDRRERLPGILRQPRAVPVLRRLPRLVARWRRFPGHRQGHGEVRLADGPGLPDGRRRHGHGRARRRRHGGRFPGPHEARLEERDAGARREPALRPEERQGLLRVRTRQEGQAEEDRRSGRRTS